MTINSMAFVAGYPLGPVATGVYKIKEQGRKSGHSFEARGETQRYGRLCGCPFSGRMHCRRTGALIRHRLLFPVTNVRSPAVRSDLSHFIVDLSVFAR
jgi:hypothetical protein